MSRTDPIEVIMSWTVLGFGKHAGKSLPQIVLKDPNWFFWAWKEGVFDSQGLKAEATLIHRKAKRIRLNRRDGHLFQVEYLVDRGAGRLQAVRIVRVVPGLLDRLPTGRCTPYYDLSVPSQSTKYDKLAGMMIVAKFRKRVCGGAGLPMTRERCEAFFDDESNFA